MNLSYKIKKGSRLKVNPAVAVKALERIRKKRGVIRPIDVVEEAANPKHPLHDYFEWDDSRAAHQHRVWQARHLLNVIVVIKDEDTEENPLTVKAFVNIKSDSDQYYVGIVQAMSDEATREQVIAQAMKELATFRSKYASIKEFAALFQAMAKIAS